MLRAAAAALGELGERVVYTGGATIPEYLDGVVVGTVRPTRDVDVVVELTTRAEYYAFMAQLDALGWGHPQLEGDHPICRRRTPDGLLIDVMPSDGGLLGFSNPWYAHGFDRLVEVKIEASIAIRMFPADVLLASKLEAFRTRGAVDWFGSHDLEDVIPVIEGRSTIVEELEAAPIEVRSFVSAWMRDLAGLAYADEVVEAHLDPGVVRAGRLGITLARIQSLGRTP